MTSASLKGITEVRTEIAGRWYIYLRNYYNRVLKWLTYASFKSLISGFFKMCFGWWDRGETPVPPWHIIENQEDVTRHVL